MWTDDEYLAGRGRTIAKMLDMCEWISVHELVALVDQPLAHELVAGWEEGLQIFSVQSDVGKLYPGFQFDSNMRPRTIIKEILAELGNTDPFATAAWFVFKNGWLTRVLNGRSEPVPPMDILEDRVSVLKAARNERGTYVA